MWRAHDLAGTPMRTMRPSLRSGLLLTGLLASALSAGFFYTYSISVMPGLAAADPLSASRVMQGINAVVRTPWFAFAFFGALLLPLASGVWAWIAQDRAVAVLSLCGAALYGLGVFAVTFLVNVPLNEGLAAVSATSDTAATTWDDYATRWTAWHHVRAISSALAFALAAAATIVQFRRSS